MIIGQVHYRIHLLVLFVHFQHLNLIVYLLLYRHDVNLKDIYKYEILLYRMIDLDEVMLDNVQKVLVGHYHQDQEPK
jgi:hypothetical protein